MQGEPRESQVRMQGLRLWWRKLRPVKAQGEPMGVDPPVQAQAATEAACAALKELPS